MDIRRTTQPLQRTRTPGALIRVCMVCREGAHDAAPGEASHGLCPGCLYELDPEAWAEAWAEVTALPTCGPAGSDSRHHCRQ